MKVWKAIQEKHVLDGKVVQFKRRFYQSQTGPKEGWFDILEASDWVNIVAMTADHHIVLVEQFRAGTERLEWEIPGGAVDPGEDPLKAAARELREETGFESDQWECLGSVSPNPAFMANRCLTFVAHNCRLTSQQELDAMEEIRPFTLPIAEVGQAVKEGRIQHCIVLSAFFLYHAYQGSSSPWQ